MDPNLRIRTATRDDLPRILEMIKALAEYERLTHRVTATESALREAFFGPRPIAEAAIAYADEEAVGVAVFFPSLSTFSGNPGMYLEDLFVEPAWRARGVGRKLLAHVAALAVHRGCEKLHWSVLDWNAPAIRFYRSFGAQPVSDWVAYSISGEQLTLLAEEIAPNES